MPPIWQAMYDMDTGNTYYHNDATGETTWDEPPSFVAVHVEEGSAWDKAEAGVEAAGATWDPVGDESSAVVAEPRSALPMSVRL